VANSIQKTFPTDRIKFLRSNSAVQADTTAMRQFANRQLTLDGLCRCFAYNNKLDRVTPEQAVNELRLLGYGDYSDLL